MNLKVFEIESSLTSHKRVIFLDLSFYVFFLKLNCVLFSLNFYISSQSFRIFLFVLNWNNFATVSLIWVSLKLFCLERKQLHRSLSIITFGLCSLPLFKFSFLFITKFVNIQSTD